MSLHPRTHAHRSDQRGVQCKSGDRVPMDKAEIMYGLDGERALGQVKPRYIFRENIIFHQHRH